MDSLLAEAQCDRDPALCSSCSATGYRAAPAQPPLLIDAISAARRDESLAAGACASASTSANAFSSGSSSGRRPTAAIDPALDSDVFARFGLTLAMGALVMRTLKVDTPAEGAWHELISRLLDAISEGAIE